MKEEEIPIWLQGLAEEDLHFIRRFVLASGSLKALGAEYGVSYPTLRSRLDRLIARIKAMEDPTLTNPLLRTVQLMAAEGQLSADAARQIIKAHKESLNHKDNTR